MEPEVIIVCGFDRMPRCVIFSCFSFMCSLLLLDLLGRAARAHEPHLSLRDERRGVLRAPVCPLPILLWLPWLPVFPWPPLPWPPLP